MNRINVQRTFVIFQQWENITRSYNLKGAVSAWAEFNWKIIICPIHILFLAQNHSVYYLPWIDASFSWNIFHRKFLIFIAVYFFCWFHSDKCGRIALVFIIFFIFSLLPLEQVRKGQTTIRHILLDLFICSMCICNEQTFSRNEFHYLSIPHHSSTPKDCRYSLWLRSRYP